MFVIGGLVRACGLTAVVAWALYQFWRQSALTPSLCHADNTGVVGDFVDVGMSSVESKLAIKYKLTRFTLGHNTTGKLVLMIPGHCGGHRQFTKIAHQLSTHNHTVYAIDHDGEYSGFHGQSVLEEAEFAVDSIAYMRLRAGGEGTKVVVVGHSMGGVAAMAVTMMAGYRDGSVDGIVTFATSHLKPPVSLDPKLHHIYGELSRVFPQKGVPLVSVVNSPRDLMVDPAMSITRYGRNVNVEQFGCRPDHVTILTCRCVVNNILGIIGDTHLDSISHYQPATTDWFAKMFRQFGVMIIAVGVQLTLLVSLHSAIDGSSCAHHLASSLNYKTVLLFGCIYSVYGILFHNTKSLGLWAIACLGPNYLFLTLISSIGVYARGKLPTTNENQETHSFHTLLTLTLITIFAPYPYAVLIINLMIAACLLRYDYTTRGTRGVPLPIFAYLQIMNAPSLLVWVKGVSRGWVSFGDIDVLRAFPLALFAYCLKTGRLRESEASGPITVALFTLLTWFGEKETFRIGDAFAVYLLLLIAIPWMSSHWVSKFTAKDGLSALDGVQEGM